MAGWKPPFPWTDFYLEWGAWAETRLSCLLPWCSSTLHQWGASPPLGEALLQSVVLVWALVACPLASLCR